MTHSLSKTNLTVLIGAPVLIIGFLFLLMKSSVFLNSSHELSIAITLDLILSIPVIYFLTIRKTSIPNISTISVFVASLFVAGFILPEEHQSFLKTVKFWAIPIIEFAVVGFVVISAKRTISGYRAQKDSSTDFYDAIKLTCRNIFPGRVAALISTEIAVIYYSLFSGKAKDLAQYEFSYTQKNGIKSVIGVAIFLILIEAFAAHILIQIWSETAAFILTALSFYTCLQFLALMKSLDHRPVTISKSDQDLKLRYGFFSETTISFDQIEEIIATKKSLPEDKSIIQFSPLGHLDSHNLIIHLKDEHTLFKMYGIQKTYTSIAIYVDEREEFIRAMEQVKSLN